MNDNANLPSIESVLGAFSAASTVTADQVKRLAESNQALEQRPKFLADLQKANVVTALKQALEKRNENQSTFAQRWGKTRQYVSRIFNLEAHTNFTIDTVVEAALLVGMRVTVKIHKPEQEVVLRTRASMRNAYRTKVDPHLKTLQSASNNSHAATPSIDPATLAA